LPLWLGLLAARADQISAKARVANPESPAYSFEEPSVAFKLPTIQQG
jgi:hypothetical protein